MSEEAADPIHPATPARYEQARRDGDYAKSSELAVAIQMLGAILVAFLMFGPLANWIRQSTTEIWSLRDTPQSLVRLSTADFTDQIRRLIYSSLSVLAPIGLLLVGIGVLAHWCQTGPLFLTNKPAPDPARLAPTNWLGRLFSLHTLALPIIGLPKSLIAWGVMLASCWFNRESFFALGAMPADTMVTALFHLVLRVSAHVAGFLLLASVLDYGIKVLSFQKRLQMTDQQLRDESKTQNGTAGRRQQ